VHDLPGMTRDRLGGEVEWMGCRFAVCDTGGIDLQTRDALQGQVVAGARQAAVEADLVVLIVDGRAGLLGVDAELVDELRRTIGSGFVFAVNKIDAPVRDSLVGEFSQLGIDPTIGVSAEHGHGLGDLLDAIVARLPQTPEGDDEPAGHAVAVALVGRPNVGKSTLFNRLVGEEASVVSEVAGTTRDVVDVIAMHGDLRLKWVDTAGIRRRGRTESGPERLGVVMARRAIERADVAVVVLDAVRPVAHQDAAIAGLADDAGKGIVFALTKWDLVTDPLARRRELEDDLDRKLRFLSHCPRVTVSGETGRGRDKLLGIIKTVDQACRRRVATPDLNRLIERKLANVRMSGPGVRDARILYATQTGGRPPTFTFFTNRRVAPHFSMVRRFVNLLRDEFELAGTPIRIRFRARTER